MQLPAASMRGINADGDIHAPVIDKTASPDRCPGKDHRNYNLYAFRRKIKKQHADVVICVVAPAQQFDVICFRVLLRQLPEHSQIQHPI